MKTEQRLSQLKIHPLTAQASDLAPGRFENSSQKPKWQMKVMRTTPWIGRHAMQVEP